jgi:NAD(P)-dependent dehydrogenase (short-subunit alcohol dehydrogenase family)
MQDFRGRVAVVTGAASGIGKGLAERAAEEGMSVVLADIDCEGLDQLSEVLRESGAPHLVVPTDVADAAQVETLAKCTLDTFGQVDLLFNNAGVLLTGYTWERSIEDWDWIVGINLRGAINGIRSFVPVLLEQNTEAHIVNTSSPAGFLAAPFLGPYTVTKQAILALTETLCYELAALNAKVEVHALCPLNVASRIMDTAANRPIDSKVRGGPDMDQFEEAIRAGMDAGATPAECADHAFHAIREGRYWIFVNPEFKEAYRNRVEDILAEKNPVFDYM